VTKTSKIVVLKTRVSRETTVVLWKKMAGVFLMKLWAIERASLGRFPMKLKVYDVHRLCLKNHPQSSHLPYLPYFPQLCSLNSRQWDSQMLGVHPPYPAFSASTLPEQQPLHHFQMAHRISPGFLEKKGTSFAPESVLFWGRKFPSE
jgi:hypothetical protein